MTDCLDVPSEGVAKATEIWTMAKAILKSAPNGHSCYSIYTHTVKYFGMKKMKMRRRCVLCKGDSASNICIQCSYKNCFGVHVIVCSKCKARHEASGVLSASESNEDN
jgi:hypothetical protein